MNTGDMVLITSGSYSGDTGALLEIDHEDSERPFLVQPIGEAEPTWVRSVTALAPPKTATREESYDRAHNVLRRHLAASVPADVLALAVWLHGEASA